MNLSNFSYFSFIGGCEVLTTINYDATKDIFFLKSEVLVKKPGTQNSYNLMDVYTTNLKDDLHSFADRFEEHMKFLEKTWENKVTPTEEGVD